MKKPTLAFLYNIRHQYPDPHDPRTHLEADLDDPQSIKAMVQHLSALGHRVLAIEADQQAYLKLLKKRKKIDLVFNYSLGIYGKAGYAQIPAMLEMLQIPYTGSSPLTQALVMNKAKAKEIFLANNIPTLAFQVFQNQEEKLKPDLDFPLIVKPVARGSSAGITNKSVVNNEKELKEQVGFINNTFKEPALVEPFLTGREFSVGLLGNPPEILPIIESDHSKLPKDYLPLDTLRVKWLFEEEAEESNLVCPAKIEKELEKKIKKICFRVWQALNVYDLCRIDIRCDKNNNPFVLEANSPPGLLPPEISTSSYFPLACRAQKITYPQLLEKIISLALKRYSQSH